MKLQSTLLLLLLAIGAATQTVQLFSASGTVGPNSAPSTSLSGSLRGGRNIYIQGIGFPLDSTKINVLINSLPCKIAADGVNTNIIACETADSGSATTIGGFPINVLIQGVLYPVPSTTFTYSSGDTPLVTDVFPSVSVAGTVLNFFGFHKAVDFGNGLLDTGDFYSLLVGGAQCSMFDLTQMEPPGYNGFGVVKCVQNPEQEAGKYNVSTHVVAGISNRDPSLRKPSLVNEYYEHIVLPEVRQVTPNQGFLAGQDIVIKGTGFSIQQANNQVRVDGTICDITSPPQHNQINCRIRPYSPANATLLTTNSTNQTNPYVSGPGFRYTRYDITGLSTRTVAGLKAALASPTGLPIVEQAVRAELYSPDVYGSNYAQVFKGYFYAPVTGNYTFRGAGDDIFLVEMSTEPGTSNAPVRTIISANSAVSDLDNYYLANQTSALGSPILLGAGSYYYLQAFHINNAGTGLFKVSVQVPNDDITLPYQSFEVNHIETTFTNGPEILRFRVEGVVGTFNISDRAPIATQATCRTNATVSNFISCLTTLPAYRSGYGIVGINHTSFDINGSQVALGTGVATEWVISITRLRTTTDLARLPAIVLGTFTGISGITASFTQARLVEHAPIISGTFRIDVGGQSVRVWDSTARTYSVDQIPFNVAASDLQNAFRQIPGLSRVRVFRPTATEDTPYGAKWIIYYNSYNNDVPDLVISGSGLLGGLAGTNPQIAFYQTKKYSSGIVFNPVDQTFARLPASAPQVSVTVNGVPSACTGTCAYTFLGTSPTVTAQSVSGATVTVAINDPLNETYSNSDLIVKVGGKLCTIATGAWPSFTCTLPVDSFSAPTVPAGAYDVEVFVQSRGLAGIEPGLAKLEFNLEVNSVTPNSGGSNGGYRLLLSASGIADDSDELLVNICNKTATVLSVANNNIEVIAPGCTEGPSEVTVTLVANNITDSGAYTYVTPSVTSTITGISPNSASPVQKGIITITGTGFGTDRSLITVYLANQTGKVYPLRVMSVNDTVIRAGLGGGIQGTYKLEVSIDGQGDISVSTPEANVFRYELVIDSISPTEGSYFGGTLLTITGRNFLTERQSTAISIGDELNDVCKVETLSSTQITCRMPTYNAFWQNSTQGVIVTNRLIQNSICPSGQCGFTYISRDNSPSLSAISVSSTVSGRNNIFLTGQNLNLGASVSVVLENVLTSVITTVTPISVLAGTVQFTTPNVEAGVYNVRVRNDPVGQTNSLRLTLQSSVNNTFLSGSVFGGSAVIAGTGLPSQWPSRLFAVTISINGFVIPLQVISTSTEKLEIAIPPGVNGRRFTIIMRNPNSLAHTITYTQGSGSTPNLTLLSSTTLTPGLNTVRINRTSTIATVRSANVSALFVFNVLTPDNLQPVNISTITYNNTIFSFPLTFGPGAYGFRVVLNTGYGIGNLTDRVTVSAPSPYTVTNKDVSYLGGSLTVQGSGINPDATITVGGSVGRITQLNANDAVFSVPPLITTEVLTQFPEITTSQVIRGTFISNGGDNAAGAFDGVHATFYESTAAGACFIGIDVGANKRVNIKKIKYFPFFRWTIAADFLRGGIFQASVDGTTYTTIGQVDPTVRSGWNTLVVQNNNAYRFIRFSHTDVSGCKLSQLQFTGVVLSTESVGSNIAAYAADVAFSDGFNNQTFAGALTFKTSKTPIIDTISPNYGTVYGGDTLTFTGSNLGFGTVSVVIDGIACVVDAGSITATGFTCVTGARLTLPQKNSLTVTIDSNNAIVKDQFYYVMRWSDERTWGTDLPPVEGDLVAIPQGMTLLVDQSTPRLQGIVGSQGKLFFADESDIEVHTNFITINGGQFRAGTERRPYQHKLTFTLYGSYYGKQQPMFGNKGIGCMNCKFSMYGKPRVKTWTVLDASITVGATSLTLNQNVDWQVGETIVVTSSDFDYNQAETRVITAISGRAITVDRPFVYKHSGEIESFGADSIDMRAEVGLLSRNIKMKGDPTSEAGIYGSHLMMAGTQKGGMVSTVAYSQFTHCGQPRITGRYCIHFHMNGDVPQSLVKGNAVHDSFARIITLHGVHYLRVQDNVGYKVKGHNIFLEDGIETMNVIEGNLVINSLQTFNMMQTDVSVASYWITNPTNTVRNNRAAGGDFYAYWYEVKEHPDGPSASMDICPQGMPTGESHDNVAHSYVRFGLRIFKLASRQSPCAPSRQQGVADPWAANPSIQSRFYNYVTYKIGEAGLLAEDVGNMIFENFTMAESGVAGMMFYTANHSKQLVEARNMAIIGVTTTNTPSNLSIFNGARGVISPRTGGWKMSNIRFYNMDSKFTVLQVCALCNNVMTFTNNPHEQYVENIQYNGVTGNYLVFNGLKRDIIYDLDGSFSVNFDNISRPKATLVRGFNHLKNDNACKQATTPNAWDRAVACDETALVRRVLFTNLQPVNLFASKPMKVQLLSDINEVVSPNSTNFTEFFSIFQQKEPKKEIRSSYGIPFIAGRIYNAWWFTGIDFTNLAVDAAALFEPTDPAIIFKFNYTEKRELFEIDHLIFGASAGLLKTPITGNNTLNPATCQFGDYTHNQDLRQLTFCVSSRGKLQTEQYMTIGAVKCRYLCPAQPSGEFVKETFTRLWSNTSQWPNNQLPQNGENVTIPGEWTIIMDVNPAPISMLIIDGDVMIPPTISNLVITAKTIWVRAGSLNAGSQSAPHPNRITFRLTGNKEDSGYFINPQVGGNKLFAITGNVSLYGQAPATTWTRLTAVARTGDTSIRVAALTDWAIGDEISIGSSYSNTSQHQKVTIQTINNSTNTITFTPALRFNHFGATGVTVSNSIGQLDTRSVVAHLTRRIRFEAGADDGWGYTINVHAYMANNEKLRSGGITFSGVQFVNGGKYDTEQTAIRIENTIGTTPIVITKSSFQDCKTYCLYLDNINNAQIVNNVIYNVRVIGVRAVNLNNYNFQNNVIMGVIKRPTLAIKELEACYLSFGNLHNNNVTVIDNVCQGSVGHGFAISYIPCTMVNNNPYRGNSANSAQIGFIFTRVDSNCQAFADIRAFACDIGQLGHAPSTDTLIYRRFMIADCKRAASLRLGREGDDKTAFFQNSYISAISRPSCSDCYGPTAIECSGNHGVRLLMSTVNGEELPGKFGPMYDVVCKSETYDSKAFLTNVTFQNFRRSYSTLPQCTNNVVFRPHDISPDLIGSHHLSNSPCVNCELSALAFFPPPNPSDLGWFGGCGSLLCTGRNNYLIHDHTGHFLGGQPGILLANNTEIGNKTNNCNFISEMNGHHCTREDIGVIEYESIAPDFNLRNPWPVYLKYDGGLWNTSTNGFREWEWFGGEPLNRRLGRFVSVVELFKTYNMTFESEPPQDMRFQFQRTSVEGNNSEWIIVKLYYPRPNSIRVQTRTEVIKPITMLTPVNQSNLDVTRCGSNKFFYQNYTVHFVLTGDKSCQVRVSLTNTVQLNARLAMDINQFFQMQGETVFIQRLAAVLGITDYSRIKVVGVYNGSVNIVTLIEEPISTDVNNATQRNNTAAAQEMQRIHDLLATTEIVSSLGSSLSSAGLGSLSDVSASLFFTIDPENNGENSEDDNKKGSRPNNVGLIVGVVVGSIVLITVIITSVVYVSRKRAKVFQTINPQNSEDLKEDTKLRSNDSVFDFSRREDN